MKNPPLAQLLPSLKKSIIPNPTAKFEKVNSFVKWGKGAGREGGSNYVTPLSITKMGLVEGPRSINISNK